MRCGCLRPMSRFQVVFFMLWYGSFDCCKGQNLSTTEQESIHENEGRRLAGHAYISLTSLKRSDGEAQIDKTNNTPSLKSRDTESDRAKKNLVRAAECQHLDSATIRPVKLSNVAAGCLRGGNRARIDEKSTTVSSKHNETYNQIVEDAHFSKQNRKPKHSSEPMIVNRSRSQSSSLKTKYVVPRGDNEADNANEAATSPSNGATQNNIPDLPVLARTPPSNAPTSEGFDKTEKAELIAIEFGSFGGDAENLRNETSVPTAQLESQSLGDYDISQSEKSTKKPVLLHQNSSTADEKSGPKFVVHNQTFKADVISPRSNYNKSSTKRGKLPSTTGDSFISVLILTDQTHINTSSTKRGIVKRYKKSSRINEVSDLFGGNTPIAYEKSYKGSASIGKSKKSSDDTNDSNPKHFVHEESIVSIFIRTKDKHRSHTTIKEKDKATSLVRYWKSSSKELHKSTKLNGVEHWLHKQHGKGARSKSKTSVGRDWITMLRAKGTKASKSSKNRHESKGSKGRSSKFKSKKTKTSKTSVKDGSKTNPSSTSSSVSQLRTKAPIFSSPIFSPTMLPRPSFSPMLRETVAPTRTPSDQPAVPSTESPIVPPNTPAPSVESIPTETPTTQGATNLPTQAPNSLPATSTPTTVSSTVSPTFTAASLSPTAQPIPTQTPSSLPIPTLTPTIEATPMRTATPIGLPTLSPVVQETRAPTLAPNLAPSTAPSVEPSEIPAVAQPPGQVDASPFNLVFETDGQPSELDLLAAGALTLQYLEEFFAAQFELNSESVLVATNGAVTSTDVPESLVSFDLSLMFTENSIFIPTSSDVDNLLFAAFQPPFVDGLLTLLNTELPADTPLSMTTSVVYSQ